MPEMNNLENPQLSEIELLEKQLAEKKAALSIESGANGFERQLEMARENLPEFQQPAPAPVSTPTAARVDDSEKQTKIKQDVNAISAMDEKRKLDTLVAIALDKGINHAVEVANNLRDPFILDQLHDQLIGELHDRLVREKKLKDI